MALPNKSPSTDTRHRPLTKRLVHRHALSSAVKLLIEGSAQYRIAIRRSRIDPTTGKERDPYLILTEQEDTLVKQHLDTDFADAHSLLVVVEYPDQALVKVDFGLRFWEAWLYSESLEERIKGINAHLKASALPRILTPGLWYGLAGAVLATVILGGSMVSAIIQTENGRHPQEPPEWLLNQMVTLTVPALVLASIGAIATLFSLFVGGRLGFVRPGLNTKDIRYNLWAFRGRNFTTDKIDKLVWVVATAVLTAIITALLS